MLVMSTSVVKSPSPTHVLYQAAAKQYKVTGTGKVILRHPGKQHINEKKSSKRLSNLGKAHLVSIYNSYDVHPRAAVTARTSRTCAIALS